MKNLSMLILSLLLSSSWAAEAPTANIHAGNWQTGAGFSFYSQSGYNDRTDIDLAVRGNYFVMDRLALGLTLSHESEDYESGRDFVDTRIGPSAIYFVLQHERLAPFVRAYYQFGLADASSSVLGAGLGAEYFVTPSVAFGPSVFMTWIDAPHPTPSYERIGFSLGFDIYL